MGISKTGCSKSITKEDLNRSHKQGFYECHQIYQEKSLELIKRLRNASYNHAYFGTDMAIDEETAVSLVEEIFGVEEPLN